LLLATSMGSPDPEMAFQQLVDFAIGIDEHRAFEQRTVYRPLIEIARKKDLKADVDLTRLVGEMDGDWADYLHDWPIDCIADDWKNFSGVTQRILKRAAERLYLENSIIYPLALREGTILLREPQT
jgi:hypothetical protein